jgi:uncharacterized membrane-anchored protein
MNAVLSFWLAYILTRPLGASNGDLLSQHAENGGYGLSTVGTSILFLSIIWTLDKIRAEKGEQYVKKG